MKGNENLTPVSALGEFGLIERLSGKFAINPEKTIRGIGDDAAVLQNSGEKKRLLSTDILIEGVHFDLSFIPMQHLGYKAIVANLSDICAMNAVPDAVTVSIAMSNRFSVEAIESLYDGIALACKKYGVDLVGGDTSSSVSGLVISVTASGLATEKEIVYRDGAGTNDLVCVTGDLGAAFAGLKILQREKTVFMNNPDIQPELDGYEYVIERNMKPEARTETIDLFRESKIVPGSMIDISDGLASELHHLCRGSKTGAVIYEEKIPMDAQTKEVAAEFNLPAMTLALHGGEDYELLFTVGLEDFNKVNHLSGIHIIGHMTDPGEGVRLMTRSGGLVEIASSGWDHFREVE